jgi:pimeloyl-ACP methyl ester carboxylesterase
MRRWLGVALAALVLLALGLVAAAWLVGTRLAAPAQRPIGAPPADLSASRVTFGGLVGWWVPGAAGAPCVILMHGVHADRRDMLGRARFLQAAGYSSLLFDFQAHGESAGELITFGHREAGDARAAVKVARETFGCRRVAAIGDSLGGAAALLGERPLEAEALVLEAVYASIEEAVADRIEIRFGRAGRVLEPILTSQLRWRFGIEPRELRPIERIGAYPGPVLVIGGVEDRHTTIDATRRLFAAARGPRDLWEVSGAAHVDFHRFAPAEYERRVLTFLSRAVGPAR